MQIQVSENETVCYNVVCKLYACGLINSYSSENTQHYIKSDIAVKALQSLYRVNKADNSEDIQQSLVAKLAKLGQITYGNQHKVIHCTTATMLFLLNVRLYSHTSILN